MNPGLLRHRVTFQWETATPDGRGGTSTTWGGDVTVWARVQPLTAHERLVRDQISASASHRFTVRAAAVPGLTEEARVTMDGRTWRITGITDPDELGAWLVIDAIEEDR